MAIAHANYSGFTVTIEHTNPTLRPNETYSWSPSLLTDPARPYGTLSFLVGARAEDCVMKITEATYKPVGIVGFEFHYNTLGGLR